MDKTKIEWTDATWNPITGCSRVSAGCEHCYAERLAGTRLKHHPSREGLTRETKHGPVWTGEVNFNEQWLDQPLRWKRPRRIFVAAHSDLFHERVPFNLLDAIFEVMRDSPQHTFQILTKRPERMKCYLTGRPLPNVYLGVSIESAAYVERCMPLRNTPAAVRFLSLEPLLGPVAPLNLRGIGWVIVGGESGPGARPMHPQWARDIRDQCQAADVPYFFKQWGEWMELDDVPVPYEEDQFRIKIWRDTEWVGGENVYSASLGPEDAIMARIGKKRAGRMLDGRTWDEMPVTPGSAA